MERQAESTFDLGYYLDLASRRKFFIIVPFVAVSFVTLIAVAKLPKVYSSSGVILIQEQQIPKNMVETTITDLADQRMGTIKQRILTTANVVAIIDKFQLYPDARGAMSDVDLSKMFQDSLEIKPVTADLGTRYSSASSMAFTIGFTHPDAETAWKVAQELVTLFLNENVQVRTERAQKTTEFLNAEAEKFNQEIQTIENQIADFKQKHGESLPDMLQVNISMIDRTTAELQDAERQSNVLKDRIGSLTAELGRIKAYGTGAGNTAKEGAGDRKPMTREEQLRVLNAEYIDLASRYNPTHPDVLRVKRQIQALEPSFSGAIGGQEAQAELAKARAELQNAQERYAANHPDIARLKQKVEALQKSLSGPALRSTPEPDRSASLEMSDPVYFSVLTQLKSSQAELESLNRMREQLRSRLQELQAAVSKTPESERVYVELMRDRASRLKKYEDLMSKALDAKLAQTLEEEKKAETFSLIEPPVLPTSPEKRSRKKVVLVGLVASVASGLGSAYLMEMIAGGVRGVNALMQITGTPPIVVIPYIENEADLANKRRRIRLVWISAAGFVVFAVLVIHFFVMSLGQVWTAVLWRLTH